MLVTYADNHTWKKTIEKNFVDGLGNNNAKKLRQFLPTTGENKISHHFSVLDTEFFEWFQPLYDALIASRKNFGGYNVQANTLYNTRTKYTHYSLTIMVDNVPIGGAIFTLRPERLSIAYRAFPPQWPANIVTRCTPALYAEYLMTNHALENGLTGLAHGADRNPYGIHSGIGIAIFKLSVGCHPELQKTYTKHSLDLASVSQDVLVLEYPAEGTVIKQAFLACNENDLPKYEQLFKYPEHLAVQHWNRINTILKI